ncbi:2-amino-4-hydroxy-6-hydroxymethyldihydropteridine diphosphokinase [Litorivivens sp.]|uniref:2-amino-4-hydroxy-6- hydroxymethyldihydropteridine diphosphokinase n=1 Tax=Litorivivens sp. TaxID=2020868 RepID=UPI00356988FA
MTVRCYLGLGSNQADPQGQLSQALDRLAGTPGLHNLRCSRFYGSKAVGPGEQADYVNAVASVDTLLSPLALLDTLQQIENLHGRVRDVRWGPRTLDLDLLLYGEQTINTARLVVPHPRLAQRAFVLVPLAELAPDLTLPDGTCLSGLLDYASAEDLWLLQ